jgi:hypothetical protein
VSPLSLTPRFAGEGLLQYQLIIFERSEASNASISAKILDQKSQITKFPPSFSFVFSSLRFCGKKIRSLPSSCVPS